jgi:hypothetical protein
VSELVTDERNESPDATPDATMRLSEQTIEELVAKWSDAVLRRSEERDRWEASAQFAAEQAARWDAALRRRRAWAAIETCRASLEESE